MDDDELMEQNEEENEEEFSSEEIQEQRERIQKRKSSTAKNKSAGKKAGKKAGEKASKKVAEQAAKKGAQAAAQAGGKISALGALGPILIWVIVIVLIIIVVVGIIGFIITMPGLMMNKITEFFGKLGSVFSDVYTDIDKDYDENKSVSKQQIIDTAEYIESMGYDLLGFGFVEPNISIKTVDELEKQGYTRIEEKVQQNNKEETKITLKNESTGAIYSDSFYDVDGTLYGSDGFKVVEDGACNKYGILYNNTQGGANSDDSDDENGKISNIKSLDNVNTSNIKTYLVSENRMFALRNNTKSWLDRVGATLFGSASDAKFDDKWANGLIKLYVSQSRNWKI